MRKNKALGFMLLISFASKLLAPGRLHGERQHRPRDNLLHYQGRSRRAIFYVHERSEILKSRDPHRLRKDSIRVKMNSQGS